MKKIEATIINYLKPLARDDDKLLRLLAVSLGRVLNKSASRGDNWQTLCSRNDAAHIANWLSTEARSGAEWLANIDDLGRPKKLLKYSSVEQILKDADRAVKLANERIGLVTVNNEDEEIIAELSDGYYLTKLMSKNALDNESKRMQHCIGHGDYDDYLEDDHLLFVSLRDKHGNPHATLEVQHPSPDVYFLEQLQGKQNKLPKQEYLDILLPFLNDENWGYDSALLSHEVVRDINNKVHPIRGLPKGFHSPIDVDWWSTSSGYSDTLPDNMKVDRDLYLVDSELTELPDNLYVGGNLIMASSLVERLHEKLTVIGNINASSSHLKEIVDNFVCRGNLDLSNTLLTSLPRNLTVGGVLNISLTRISEIPDCCKIGTKLIVHDDQLDSLVLPENVGSDIELVVIGSENRRDIRIGL